MQRLDGYMAGVNLGGWLSQYGDKGHDHFKSFIVEEDIKLIASWGMDHIRIPVDYPVLEEENDPCVYLEEGFGYLKSCVEWAKKYNLNVIIDVHRAPGFSFNTPDQNTLFTDPKMQERFVCLWKEIANRYKCEGGNIMYELLNEIVEPDSSRWNPLAQKLIDGIREIDREHYIIVGGIHYNSASALALLPIFNDPKIVYNFHMYEPHIFTHQHAGWSKLAKEFDRSISYPSDLSDYLDFHDFAKSGAANASTSHLKAPVQFDTYDRMDARYLRGMMKPAIDFMKKHNKPMYCGEYGVIDVTDMASRENWSEDASDIMLECGIGRAAWTYKSMSFALVDGNREPVSDRLIKVYSKH